MRRVVVTGVGLVSPLGGDVSSSWARLLEGKSGARRVDNFEVSDISCQIACYVPRGNPEEGHFKADDWMAPKEQRKVDDFIVYAVAAAGQALKDSGFEAKTTQQQERAGVHRFGNWWAVGHCRHVAAFEGKGTAPGKSLFYPRPSH